MGLRLSRKALMFSAVGLALCSAALAAAAVVERVQVGGRGRNETLLFSPQLYVTVGVVADYTHVSNDGDGGDWQGPRYHATGKPTLAGDFRIGWGVAFEHTALEAAAREYTLKIGSWSIVQQGSADVPHVIRGVKVGTLKGVTMVTKSAGAHGSQFSSAVAFPLCRGHVVVAHFSALEPFSDSPNPFGQYVASDGTGAAQWNQNHVTSALGQVVLDGYLPLARISAKASGRRITGVATDCAGHPAAGIAVHAKRARATTSSSGAFVLRVKSAGTYVVTGSSGAGSAQSKRLRIR